MHCRPALILGLLILGSVLSGRVAAGLAWESTRLSFKPEFGVEKVSGQFHFKNTGDRPITITGIQSSCGCTTVNLAKKTYAVGEAGTIEAAMTLQPGEGLRSKTISVMTDDLRLPVYILTIEADSPKMVELTPRLLLWSYGEPATTRTITATVTLDRPVKILEANPAVDRFTVKLETVEPGKLYKIHVTPVSTEVVTTTRINIVTDTPADNPVVHACYARVLRATESVNPAPVANPE